MAEIIVDVGDNLVETIGCEYSGELVRCKECKFYKSDVVLPNGTIVKCISGVKEDDYCSYGERREP